VRCETAAYRASLNATVTRGDPFGSALLAQITNRTATVRIDPADVPGIRLVTQCPANPKPTSHSMECVSRLAFWRERSQFAPQLGVDFSRMRDSNQVKWQEIERGSGPLVPCCFSYNGSVRYRLSLPDGRMLRERHVTDATRDSVLQFHAWGIPLHAGSRVLMLVPSAPYTEDHNQYGIAVLDVTLLPPPTSAERR
jgi:hypothetical protein